MKARTKTTARQRVETVETRLCVKRVKNGRTSMERAVTRRRLPFTTPGQLIRDVTAALVPEWLPIKAHITKLFEYYKVEISYGKDANGTETFVAIDLEEADILLFIRYLLRSTDTVLACTLILGIDIPDEDDGGLRLPTVTQAALDAMPTQGTYQ